MNTNNQINLLEQAQAARSLGNWSLMLQCLQQLTIRDSVPRQQKPAIAESEPEKGKILDLALEALVVGDFNQRWEIAKIIPKLGHGDAKDINKIVVPLIEILADEDADEELRWYAGRILGEFNHPCAIAALVELLKTSDNEELNAVAVAALGQIGSPAVAALTQLLAQENTRLLAVRSLSHIRCSETIAPLLSVVQDPQITIRAAAIEALGSFHDPRIPPILLHTLDDSAASVRREAVLGLGFRPELQEELDLVNRLTPRLYDFNIDVCVAGAIALGRLGTDAAATALFQVLKSPHTPVPLQLEIIRSLGRIGTTNSWEYLRLSLAQQLPVIVLQEVVTILGRSQPQLKAKAAEILIEILKTDHRVNQHQSTKQAIALSLSYLGNKQAIEPLIGLLADDNAGVRLHVIAALKQIDSQAAHHQLQQMATNSGLALKLQQGIAIALQEWTSNNSEG